MPTMNEAVALLTEKQLQSLLIDATKAGFHQCMMQLQQSEWMDITQVCEHLKVGRKWVYEKSDIKKNAVPLPSHGPTGAKRWNRNEVDEWFRNHSNEYSNHLKTA